MVDIKGAMKKIGDFFDGLRNVTFSIVITVILLGVLLATVTSGTITIPTGLNTILTTLITNVGTWITNGTNAITTAAGLVIVVVLAVLFRKYFGGSGKKKGDVM